MGADMTMHQGGRIVSLEELETMSAPEPTRSWSPIRHYDLLSTAIDLLNEADFLVNKLTVATARHDQWMFATIDLTSTIDEGVNLAVGVRSSTNKKLALGLVAGSRVFACDNLCFHGDIAVINKHTPHGVQQWQEGIRGAIGTLDSFVAGERHRVTRLRQIAVDDRMAHHIIFLAMWGEVINHMQAIEVAAQWHNPPHDEFRPRTAWSLYNGFTEVLKPMQVKNFARFSSSTMSIYPLLINHVGTN